MLVESDSYRGESAGLLPISVRRQLHRELTTFACGHYGFGFQQIEIGEVAQRRQLLHGDLQLGVALAPPALQQIEGVFRGEQLIEPGHHTEHRDAGVGLQPAAPLIKQLASAPHGAEGSRHSPLVGTRPLLVTGTVKGVGADRFPWALGP